MRRVAALAHSFPPFCFQGSFTSKVTTNTTEVHLIKDQNNLQRCAVGILDQDKGLSVHCLTDSTSRQSFIMARNTLENILPLPSPPLTCQTHS